MATGKPTTYLLDSGTDLGAEQLDHLSLLLDAHSFENLDPLVRPGHHCLEIGAGGGTIARGLVERVGPTGKVIAIDIETGRVAATPGLEVREHDITTGAPDGGPFDVIHARLVLMHLPQRREIIAKLMDALVPGGWLVIGEFKGPHLEVVSAPNPDDARVFQRVVETVITQIGMPGGISYTWATEVDACMMRTGLVNVESRRYARTVTGGSAGCLLLRNYVLQVASHLGKTDLTEAEVHRFFDLMGNPEFRCWLFELTYVRAQRIDG
ncbi:hypothetical protein DSC45_22165 [Streptomyces sp. YIM 130001]|uniref:class I SAM-dependent methyltransferase n=1 Tax=Streptomyces sp. YIM 130001 TaxID=2259644 RepID=UPI000E65A71E|nr:class I SAM-dependent methyltransferase [Streptomyces sp. YIM 130001]RII14012.1 hypothetical protein DSC45_22165 [Streptomyces sp. YIM 130001]